MDRFRASIDALRRGEPVPEDGYQGEYVVALAAEEGDPVPKMLASIEATMERFRIHFDSWALQSELEQRLPEFLPRLDTYEKDGAVWARSSAYGDEQDWVLIRSADRGGTPTYRAADVVYLVDKLERGYDRAIYVLGADHHATARWYAAIARMLGYDPDAGRGAALPVRPPDAGRRGVEGVEARRQRRLPRRRDGRDRRRRGALVPRQPRPGPDDRDRPRPRCREVAEEPGLLRAVRARAHRRDPAERRRRRDRRRAARAARERGEGADQAADRLPGDVREAAERRGPQLLPAYAIRLADDFHRFYHECRVLGDPPQSFRLGLCRATQQVIARSLDLLGVEAPERM